MHAPQVFKRSMDAFLEPLFRCVVCEHQLCRTAAGACVGALRDFVGPGIFAGHLTEEQAVLLDNSPDVPSPGGAIPAHPALARRMLYMHAQVGCLALRSSISVADVAAYTMWEQAESAPSGLRTVDLTPAVDVQGASALSGAWTGPHRLSARESQPAAVCPKGQRWRRGQ